MRCNDAALLIHAYLDDELGAGDSVWLTRHLAECPACTQELKSQVQLKSLLQRAKPEHATPAAARARILAALPSSAVRPSLPRLGARRWDALPTALAASLLLLLGGGIGIAWQQRTGDAATLAADLVSDHVRSLQPQHLTDVLTSDRHTVKPWFDGKLEFSPQVRDLNADGFVLIGGRLDVLHARRVAAIVYRRRQHMINLFQWPDTGSESTPASADVGDGYTATHWVKGGMAYWAVSNLDRAEMESFAAAFRDAPEVGTAKPD